MKRFQKFKIAIFAFHKLFYALFSFAVDNLEFLLTAAEDIFPGEIFQTEQSFADFKCFLHRSTSTQNGNSQAFATFFPKNESLFMNYSPTGSIKLLTKVGLKTASEIPMKSTFQKLQGPVSNFVSTATKFPPFSESFQKTNWAPGLAKQLETDDLGLVNNPNLAPKIWERLNSKLELIAQIGNSSRISQHIFTFVALHLS